MSHRYFTDRVEGDRAFLCGEEAAHLARVRQAARTAATAGAAAILCFRAIPTCPL